MKVCLICGYIDDPLWRQAVEFGLSYMPLADFETLMPIVAKRVLNEKFVEEGYYVYHLTKGRNVQRQALMDNPNYKTHWTTKGYYERVNHGCPTNISDVPKAVRRKGDKKQIKLFSVDTKEKW